MLCKGKGAKKGGMHSIVCREGGMQSDRAKSIEGVSEASFEKEKKSTFTSRRSVAPACMFITKHARHVFVFAEARGSGLSERASDAGFFT